MSSRPQAEADFHQHKRECNVMSLQLVKIRPLLIDYACLKGLQLQRDFQSTALPGPFLHYDYFLQVICCLQLIKSLS